jgi:hypothetical protein
MKKENCVLRFLDKSEIEDIIDSSATKVISYLLKKVLFSQPELRENQKPSNIQMTKEFLEQWIAQALDLKVIGAGNYPIDVYSEEDKLGIDIKFLSSKVDKEEFVSGLSNETSLAQNFKEEGKNLDQLFAEKDYETILTKWKGLLVRKLSKAIKEKSLKKIYYFIFIRGGNKISLAICEVNSKKLKSLKVIRGTDSSVFVEGYCPKKYGEVKIYKSKKRMELRTFPKNLFEDEKMISWDFSPIYKQEAINLKKLIRNEKKFDEYVKSNFNSLFSAIGHHED